MNKKGFCRSALVTLMLLCPTYIYADSAGMASGYLATADACGFGVGYIGGFAGILDDGTSLFSSLTYGFSEYTEGRIKIGFIDGEGEASDPELLFGADFKYEFMDYNDKNGAQPLDMAFGGFLEYFDSGYFSVLQIGGNLIASIPYRFQSGSRLIPYGRAGLRMEKYSADSGVDDTDFQFGLNLGAKYELTTDMNLYAEFQADGLLGLFLGLDVRMF